ncbi:hypothetical protein CNMCM7691_005873 [Aspergillus felis]|uniref:Uncharacterized protein n=1 Tax=Aspergillus felis TaxID=1287682 RepID=A0A8H6VB25_9EURO|nr:hypothetical protein CNMCM7691_005873 [Aspergillus felis]
MASSSAVTTNPCGIPGVDYDKTFVQNLESNAPALTGCFGLPDSVAVWKLINEDKDTKEVINAYITHRVNNYGYTEDYGKQPYVVQLMRAKPSLFPRTNITTDPIRLNPYDVLHGWKLLSFFWKQIQGGKKAKGKPQKNITIPPVFHTPTNPNAVLGSGPNTALAGDPGTAAAPVSVTADALFGADHAQANSYMATKQHADQLGNSALLHHNTVQETLKKVFRSDLSSAKATISRPTMTAVERDLLYKYMMEMDNFESELILHEPTDTLVGGSQTQVFLNRLAATSQASELIRVAAAEGNDTEPDEATTEAPGTGL